MNDKNFSIRIPNADHELLLSMAAEDRSTVAQQIRIAIARYVDKRATVNSDGIAQFNPLNAASNMGAGFNGMAKPWHGK